MANALKVQSILARESLTLINNEYKPLLNSFYRDVEGEFNKNVNGYKIGDTISIRRPADFTVRTSATRSAQDIVEGAATVTINKQIGVDFDLSSKDLTLNIADREGVNGLRERVVRPAVVNMINQLMYDCASTMYQGIYNWVGTPGNTVNSISDFLVAPQRLDEMAVPSDSRFAALSPADYYGMVGQQAGLYIQGAANQAYRTGVVGDIAGIGTFMTQVLPTHTTGQRGGTPLINGASQNVTYATAKDTWTQSLVTDGWTAAAANRLKAGDVITIYKSGTSGDKVKMVNPKTKQATDIDQQFVVTVDADSTAGGAATLTISPPIIVSGPHQTVDAAPADNAGIVPIATASTGYKQNLVYHRNAFALAVVPMVIPPGSVDFARESMDGLSVRVGPVYDGTNDVSGWRMDMLYGRALIDPRLATRLSGTP